MSNSNKAVKTLTELTQEYLLAAYRCNDPHGDLAIRHAVRGLNAFFAKNLAELFALPIWTVFPYECRLGCAAIDVDGHRRVDVRYDAYHDSYDITLTADIDDEYCGGNVEYETDDIDDIIAIIRAEEIAEV